MTYKSIKRWPIRFTEIGQRLLGRCVRLSFSGTQHHGPVCRLKCSPSFLQCSRYRFHGLRFLSLAAAFAYRMPARFRKADLRGKKNFGARFAPVANAAKIREFFANSRRCRRDLLWLAVASRGGGWSRN